MGLSRRLTEVLILFVLVGLVYTHVARAQQAKFPIETDPCGEKGSIHIGSSVVKSQEWKDFRACLDQWRRIAGEAALNTQKATPVKEALSDVTNVLSALEPLKVQIADKERGQSPRFLECVLFLPPTLLLFLWVLIGIPCGWVPDNCYRWRRGFPGVALSILKKVNPWSRPPGSTPASNRNMAPTMAPGSSRNDKPKDVWRTRLLFGLPVALSLLVLWGRAFLFVSVSDAFLKSPGHAWYACLENRHGSALKVDPNSISKCIEKEYGNISFSLFQMIEWNACGEAIYILVWVALLVYILVHGDLDKMVGQAGQSAWKLKKVGVVLFCYLSCGVAFGMLYFDCAAATVQKRNTFLIDAALFARGTILHELGPDLVAPGVKDKYREEEPAWGKIEYFHLNDISTYLSLNRQSVDAIAEDTPEADPAKSVLKRVSLQVTDFLLFRFNDSRMPTNRLVIVPGEVGRPLAAACPPMSGEGKEVGEALTRIVKAYPRKSGPAVEFDVSVYGWADRNGSAGAWRENLRVAGDRAKTCWDSVRNAVTNDTSRIDDKESRRELLRRVDDAKPRFSDFTQGGPSSIPPDFQDLFAGIRWEDAWSARCPKGIFGMVDSGSRREGAVGNGPATDQLWRSCAAQVRILEPDPEIDSTLVTRLTSRLSLLDLMYFSFATFTTTGYGDIRPVSGLVRLLSTIENILELLFTSLFFVSAFKVS